MFLVRLSPPQSTAQLQKTDRNLTCCGGVVERVGVLEGFFETPMNPAVFSATLGASTI
jgi:hypothetical protein